VVGVPTPQIPTAARIPVRLLTAAALLLILAACGDDNGSNTTTGATSSTAAAAPTHPTAHLTAVRAARQESVDRVVFEFTEQVPGYSVAYTPKPIAGTSGKEVAVAGTAALVVRMESASGVDLSTGFKETYTGPKKLQPAGTQAVKEVAQIEDFEGVLSWVIGVEGERPFRVSTLTSPARLVIDVPS
jgi:hypothetical protein